MTLRSPSAPAVFPRGDLADWLPVDPSTCMTVSTVFATYPLQPVQRPGDRYPKPMYAAVCACEVTWHSVNLAYLRKLLGEHRCVNPDGNPITWDCPEPTDDILHRVLAGLDQL